MQYGSRSLAGPRAEQIQVREKRAVSPHRTSLVPQQQRRGGADAIAGRRGRKNSKNRERERAGERERERKERESKCERERLGDGVKR